MQGPNLSFKNRILGAFLIAALILIANTLLAYQSFMSMQQQGKWVSQTHNVIHHLEETVSQIKDVQSAQRGYVITGDLDYLTPYYTALPIAEKHLEALEEMLADNPAQQERLQKMAKEVHARIATAAEVIALYQKSGQQPAFDAIKTGVGKREMETIRILIQQMVDEEKQLLAARQSTTGDRALVTLRLGSLSLGLCLLVLGLVFWLIHAETAKRNKVESSLQKTLTEMQRLHIENHRLGAMSDYLHGCQTIDEMLNVIAISLRDLLPSTSGALMLINSSRNNMEMVQSWGAPHIAAQANPAECWSLRRGQLHFAGPSGQEPPCAHMLGQPGGGSICFPMQAHGETLGLFYIEADDAAALNGQDHGLVRRLGEQISLSISNLRLQIRLREQSIRDPLTGMFNRRYLDETLTRELSRAQRGKQPISLLVLDIDHFKKYNDMRGHDAGDALLEHFARLLQQRIRKEDIACRYGGEEFVIVMPATPADMAIRRAQDICEATRSMKVHTGKDSFASVTVSIGVSAYPANGETGAELITAADAALYKAKNNGRDQVQATASA